MKVTRRESADDPRSIAVDCLQHAAKWPRVLGKSEFIGKCFQFTLIALIDQRELSNLAADINRSTVVVKSAIMDLIMNAKAVV